jgi:hypothetical protein
VVCAVLLQSADEEQQPAELVVDAGVRPGVKALDDVNILATDADERASFVLSVFELAFFMGR